MYEEVLSRYEAWLRRSGARPSTIEVRVRFASKRLVELGGPSGFTADAIDRWLGRDPLLRDASRATYYSHFRCFASFLFHKGLIEADPMVGTGLNRPNVPKGEARPLTDAEVRRVFSAPMNHPHVRAWLVLSFYAGMRAFEIAKLRGEDIEPDVIYVVGKGGKPARIPTRELVLDLIESEAYPRRGWMFPAHPEGHISSKTVTRVVGQHLRDAGIPKGACHRLRHTFGTTLMETEGVSAREVQELMRHSSLETTQRYCGVQPAGLSRAISKLPALLPALSA